jgi:hypothetical protein
MSKRPARSRAAASPGLSIPERVLLFCVPSDTDWEHAGITGTTVTAMIVRGFIQRDSAGRLWLTKEGRAVLAALLAEANMRANGVRYLDVSRWKRHHRAIMGPDPWPDDACLQPATIPFKDSGPPPSTAPATVHEPARITPGIDLMLLFCKGRPLICLKARTATPPTTSLPSN